MCPPHVYKGGIDEHGVYFYKCKYCGEVKK